MHEPQFLRDILVILVASVAVVPLFRRFGVSAVAGYLVAGALIGPHSLDLVSDVEGAAVLADFGVVFLLFSIGLELSVERLTALRRLVFGLGGTQVLLTAITIWALLFATGLESGAALLIGGGLAMSSTAVVLQMLVERHETATRSGRAAFAVLLAQDLAVVPLLTLVPLLGPGSGSVLPALGLAVVRAAVVLGLIVAAGRLVLRPLLRIVARGRNPELFTGIALLLVLGIGWITQLAGLSMALGAFLAGLLIAETEFRPQIEGDVEPFRGVLLALFFVSVGMSVDLALLTDRWALVAGLVIGLIALKAVILTAVALLFRLRLSTAISVGLMLAQGGEFGFILFNAALEGRVLDAAAARLAVLVAGITMLLTPALIALSRTAEARLEAADRAHPPPPPGEAMEGHVLIAGFGRVGRTLGRLLDAHEIPWLALDLDPDHVAAARAQSLPVYFGDASRTDVLKAAGLVRARAAVITLDRPDQARRAIALTRGLLPEIPILARARDLAQCDGLLAAGATQVVPELVEGSLQLGETVLRSVGASEESVERTLASFRERTYARLGPLQPAATNGVEGIEREAS